MTSEVEAVGDVLTGAAIARAVEPAAGEGLAQNHQTCLNCQTQLTGAYCSICGQKSHVHRTLRGFGHDVLHGVLHFDGKIWRTLPMLAWNPGELTRRYVHGERAKFVSPIALFLFMVFLSFAVFSMIAPTNMGEGKVRMSVAEAAKEIESDRAELLSNIREMEASKKEALANKQPTGWIDSELTRHKAELRQLEDVRVPELRQREITERNFEKQRQELDAERKRKEAQLAAAKAAGTPTAEIENDLSELRMVAKAADTISGVVEQSRSDGKWTMTGEDFGGFEALNGGVRQMSKNPQLALYKIQSNAYKFSWVLIPISIPFVWLLFFWRRQFKMFDHAVFVTYSLSFMLALAAVSALILNASVEGSATFVITVLALIFLPPIHMYRQLHRAYQTSRIGAAVRTVLLSFFAATALGLFTTLIVGLGVAA